MRNKFGFGSAFALLSLAVMCLMPASVNSAASQDQPTIAKDSVQLIAFTHSSYKQNYDVWSWVPKISYRVNGPMPSGSQLYVEYTIPGSAPVKFDCATEETRKGYWWRTECGGRDIPEDKSTTYTGPINFAIKLRNELAGTDMTLFKGRAKVGKTLSNEHGPKAANKFVYYVDHDWNLPIGYVWYTPDSVYGWDYPSFNVAFWVRGDAYKLDPHLFYKGQEVGRAFMDGMQVGKASCEARVENNTTHYVNDAFPQKAKWSRVECNFPIVKRWDKTDGGKGQPNTNDMFKLASNPGEYEFKVLWNNKLARTIKFTVGPDGKLENGIGTSNQLGSDRVIVPVQIVGDQDGNWDRAAWKADAFYGNPLNGFTPLP
ncbi:MAG TPA: hypothetical protein VGW12_17175 [Pyrinomonadaceae bacterium]|nr:hypothetical protein [Pyrinomonadaceae bacterium]